MPTTVEIPGVGDVDFPDSMSHEEITAASARLYNSSNQLAQRIRAKYPTQYNDLSDQELTEKVLAKYPGYADLAALSPTGPSVPKPVPPELSGLEKLVGSFGDSSLADEGRKNYDRRKGNTGNVNSFEGSYSSGDTEKAVAMTGAGVTVGTTLAGIGLAPKAVAAWNSIPGWGKVLIGSEILKHIGLSEHSHKLKALFGGE